MTSGRLAMTVGALLRRHGWTLAIAESCTGGLAAHHITNVPGSSDYFLLAVVAYSNASKIKMLGVPRRLIERVGAVSQEVALAMAQGVRRLAQCDLGVAITGIAGPTGGTPIKPVGLVHVALAQPRRHTVQTFCFKGSRLAVKRQASEAALQIMSRALRG